jgi:hypothetical protein
LGIAEKLGFFVGVLGLAFGGFVMEVVVTGGEQIFVPLLDRLIVMLAFFACTLCKDGCAEPLLGLLFIVPNARTLFRLLLAKKELPEMLLNWKAFESLE